MIIRNLNVVNKNISIEKTTMDISKTGIYKISGRVGCGKTSLLEEIIFGDNDVFFENDMYMEVYRKSRYKLFSYVPQSIIQLDISVKEFIFRGNSVNNLEKIKIYLNKFLLNEDILNDNFSALSGGERAKIVIISELIKDTPYLFLDEPSNHLDDLAVNILIDILSDIKNKKVILLVSHDERLDVQLTGNFIIENNKICYIPLIKSDNENTKNEMEAVKSEYIKINYLRIINSVTKNIAHYITVFFLLIILIFLAVYSHFEFKSNYNTEDLPPDDLIYISSNGYYDELNKRYAEEKRIHIDESKFYSQLKLDEVKRISNIKGIADIYIKDVKYIDELYKKANNVEQSNIGMFSCPEVVFEEFWTLTAIDLGFTYVYGKMPQDGKKQVVISLEVLNENYGYELSNEKEAIGLIIPLRIDNVEYEYEVVGVSDSNIAILSYDTNFNLGYWKYNGNTFDAFYEKQYNYYIEQDAGDVIVDEMLIITKDKQEKEVLNRLFEKYPANSFYSRVYVSLWKKNYNNERFNKVLIPNVVVSVIFMIIIVLVNISALKYNYSIIKSYENYYIDRKKIRRIFRIFTFYQYFLCFVFSLVFNTIFSEFYYIGNKYICINFIIMIIPLVISHFSLGRLERR